MLDNSRPSFAFASRWQNSPPPGAARLIDNAAWWQGFHDAALDALIARALSSNPDLTAARARSKSAQQLAGAVPGAATLSAGASAQIQGGSLTTTDSNLSSDVGLEILFDPGRGREATRRAAAAAMGEAQAQAAGAHLFLIGQVAEAYLSLRYNQRRLAQAGEDAKRQRQTLALARTLAKNGAGTRIETLRSEARLASLKAAAPALEAAVAKDLARLAILAGDNPGALPANLMAALQQTRAQPRATLVPDPGIPADLIRNRPDIQAAEARYDAARAGLGQARAALYPRLSLSGTIEADRTISSGTIASGTILSLGPTLRLPALPQKPARAGVAAAVSKVEAAHADWVSTVLKAIYEVETALLDYRAAVQTEAAADHAVSLHSQVRSLMRDAAASGEVTLADLISAEDALASAEVGQASARLSRAQFFVQLNIRLGAGVATAETSY